MTSEKAEQDRIAAAAAAAPTPAAPADAAPVTPDAPAADAAAVVADQVPPDAQTPAAAAPADVAVTPAADAGEAASIKSSLSQNDQNDTALIRQVTEVINKSLDGLDLEAREAFFANTQKLSSTANKIATEIKKGQEAELAAEQESQRKAKALKQKSWADRDATRADVIQGLNAIAAENADIQEFVVAFNAAARHIGGLGRKGQLDVVQQVKAKLADAKTKMDTLASEYEKALRSSPTDDSTKKLDSEMKSLDIAIKDAESLLNKHDRKISDIARDAWDKIKSLAPEKRTDKATELILSSALDKAMDAARWVGRGVQSIFEPDLEKRIEGFKSEVARVDKGIAEADQAIEGLQAQKVPQEKSTQQPTSQPIDSGRQQYQMSSQRSKDLKQNAQYLEKLSKLVAKKASLENDKASLLRGIEMREGMQKEIKGKQMARKVDDSHRLAERLARDTFRWGRRAEATPPKPSGPQPPGGQSR